MMKLFCKIPGAIKAAPTATSGGTTNQAISIFMEIQSNINDFFLFLQLDAEQSTLRRFRAGDFNYSSWSWNCSKKYQLCLILFSGNCQ